MQIYLGLGSNLGDRRENLARGLGLLEEKGLAICGVSPVVESPALLPSSAPAGWNLPFLNLVARCEAQCAPGLLGSWIKEIEARLGRSNPARWSPRPIDIDILLWGEERIVTAELTIPHPELHRRGFVLTPLIALQARLPLPHLEGLTPLECSRALAHHIPLWMGIVNLTPDSFSDGGRYQGTDQAEAHAHQLFEAGAHVVDLGAESTRPGAHPITTEEEWSRLEPVARKLAERYRGERLRPLISVDTHHVEVARRALELGVDMINDVSGLTSPAMIQLARDSGKDWVAMHQLTIPADPGKMLPPDADPVQSVQGWLLRRLDHWVESGLDLNRIVFDPGIGFGKNDLQSLELLRRAGELRKHGLRLLIGHSRKSFMKSFSTPSGGDRDLLTLGASLNLCAQGVDIIRVHDVDLHVRTYRGWSQLVAD